MGAGASNTSKSSLNVYQESITKIGQQLRAKASNTAQQNVNISQTITVNNEATDVCENNLLQQNICNNECYYEDRPPLYQCQFSASNGRMDGTNTNSSNCDAAFGTMDEALNYDGVCEGLTDMSELERKNICIRRARRLACPTNPVMQSTGQFGYSDNVCNDNCNKTTFIRVQELGDGKKSYDIRDGNSAIYNQPDGIDWIQLDGDSSYNCNNSEMAGSLFGATQADKDQCTTNCATNYKCVPEGERLVMGVIDCSGGEGGLCLSNTANVSLGSEQLAEANIKSEMVTDITNNFQSEVMKTISQVNSGLNFAQFNTSDEMTEITQIIKNKVSNSIKASSENESVQNSGLNQNITLTNSGIIRGSATCGGRDPPDYSSCMDKEGDAKKECEKEILDDYYANVPDGGEVCAPNVSGAGCGCDISNNTVQEVQNKQEAIAVVDSIFNTSVLNRLVSDYTLDVSQLNKGLELPNLILLLVAAVLFFGYLGGKVLDTSGTIIKVLQPVIVLFVIGVIIYFVVKSVKSEDEGEDEGVTETSTTITNGVVTVTTTVTYPDGKVDTTTNVTGVDGTVTITHPDGTVVVTHPDGTVDDTVEPDDTTEPLTSGFPHYVFYIIITIIFLVTFAYGLRFVPDDEPLLTITNYRFLIPVYTLIVVLYHFTTK